MARYVIRGGREGYERLQVLHRSRWPDTAQLFVRILQGVDSQGEPKSLAVLTFQAVAGAVVEEGLATAGEVEATLAGLEAFTPDPQTLVAQPRIFQLWRRRD